MRENHFRVDENELPYLVSEKRNDGSNAGAYGSLKTDDERIDEIVSSIYGIPDYIRFILKIKLKSFLNSKDCIRLDVDEIDLGYYLFTFTRQNEFLKTLDEFEFSKDFTRHDKLFIDCISTHSYDGLLNDSCFKELLKRTPMKFERVGGGYECDYSFADDEFTFRNEPEVYVVFNDRGKQTAYDLDMDRMELGKKLF
ncbi:hypothetical protein [Methanobrevibacter sp.]|uniref:hypothetical protein n=1 Tax=Methanobrevibacter sp. TaxID=66852 RepID=UPI00388E5D93